MHKNIIFILLKKAFKPLLFNTVVGLMFLLFSCNYLTKVSSQDSNVNKNSEQAIADTSKNISSKIQNNSFSEKEPDISDDSISINNIQDSVVNEYDYVRLYDYEFIDTAETYGTLRSDTIFVADSILEPADTTPKKKSSMQFDYPIYYTCEEKGFLDFNNRKAYLFGNAVVKYETITLISDYMEIDLENNEVFSHGISDSLGVVKGKPVFEEGSEKFQADTIRYNFKSKKGIVKNVTTEFEGSYLHGGKTKLHANKHVHMIDGKFTTCDDLDHPHFYFNISKAKVIPDDKIVSGPAFLVLADVPTPLGIPFGFFPNKKGGASGVIIPTFGEDNSRGFFLTNGGYYWMINDYVDLTFLGSIYSKGSWGAGLKSNYKVRYRFNGFLSLNYAENVFGYKGLSNYANDQMYSLIWKFNQDEKARPNSRFSADVNISSANYDKNNSTNINNLLTTNKQSSISYTKQFPNSPFNLSANIGHYQNNQTQEVSLTLPNLNFSMSTIYPLKRKVKSGETKWYEKIGVAYNMRLENSIKTTDSTLFDISFNDMTNGMSHSIPIKTSFSFLKYTTVSPSFTYNERWYLKTMKKSWQESTDTESLGEVTQEYVPGFDREWDYNAAIDWNTTLYGTFNFKGNRKVKAVRHMVTPAIRFGFHPDFGTERYKFYDQYYSVKYYPALNQYDTIINSYSRFEGLPFSRTPRGGSGTVNFSLANNLEMKVRTKNDTVSEDKKVKILESFNVGTNYNIFADSLNWAPLNVSGRTKISVVNLDFGAIFNPYAYVVNENGSYVTVNKFLYKIDTAKWRIARLTSANLSVSISLNKKASANKDKPQYDPYQSLYGYPYEYVDFSIPWDINIRYSLMYSKTSITPNITQTVNISGSFNLTEKWKIDFSTGYDIKMNKITTSSINIYRDLHCWEASLRVVPFGTYRSYMFQINVKSSMLQDLKLKKERSIYDNMN